MFIKQKILAAVTKHPKIMMFGIGLAITTAIAFAVGETMSSNHVFAAFTVEKGWEEG